MRTRQGGNSDTRSCDRVFVGILRIGFLAFPLTRRKNTPHQKYRNRETRRKLRKCIVAFRQIGFWEFGSCSDIRLGLRVLNFW
jgi:hypothetical protein